MITTNSLTKEYGALTAVSNLTMEVAKGELFGFLGPNGAGKTTTVKMLTGVIGPSSGTAIIGGYDIRAEPMKAKGITGYIPDSPFLYEKLTGIEFLKFIAGLYKLDAGRAKARALEYLEMFSLRERAGELIESFSHGMRQKLAFCAAFMIEPSILIVDEPMVGLDPRSVRLVKQLLTRFCRDGGTVFLSTHSLGVAEQLCDRIGIIQRGRLIAMGTMDELRSLSGASDPGLEEIFLTITNEIAS